MGNFPAPFEQKSSNSNISNHRRPKLKIELRNTTFAIRLCMGIHFGYQNAKIML